MHEDNAGSPGSTATEGLPPGAPVVATVPARIWAMWCPFNRRGFPVLGNFGSRERQVIILPVETWNRLCAEIPALAQTRFEVGAVE